MVAVRQAVTKRSAHLISLEGNEPRKVLSFLWCEPSSGVLLRLSILRRIVSMSGSRWRFVIRCGRWTM
jgi:hypothetical protein